MFASATPIQISPADSARVVEGVYTASLLIIVPVVVAILAALLLRKEPAATRAAIWRALFVSILVIVVGASVPQSWFSISLPQLLSEPLVLLGRAQMTLVDGTTSALDATAALTNEDSLLLGLLMLIYLGGVIVAILPAVRSMLGLRALSITADELRDPRWQAALQCATQSMGLRREIRLLLSDKASVPCTWGVFRPVVVIPRSALRLSRGDARALLLHELSHIKSADWGYLLLARVVCATFWFNPVVWWCARSLRAECEVACDDNVIRNGVRASDYAELLMRSSRMSQKLLPQDLLISALDGRSGLRKRLASICNPHRHLVSRRAAIPLVVLSTLIVTLPASTISLSPDSGTLTRLMQHASWQTRAYAVRGLAQRPDTVHVARRAADEDPDPQVRAWARAALGTTTRGATQ